MIDKPIKIIKSDYLRFPNYSSPGFKLNKGEYLSNIKYVPMFQPEVRRDDIVRVNHLVRGIDRFGAWLFRHGFVLKRRLGGLKKESVYKLTLASTPK